MDDDSFFNPQVELEVQDTRIIVYFDYGERNVVLDLKTQSQADLANVVLADPNFWLQFLNSLSTALNNHVESERPID